MSEIPCQHIYGLTPLSFVGTEGSFVSKRYFPVVIAIATLPVIAFILLSIYGKVIRMTIPHSFGESCIQISTCRHTASERNER